MKMKTEVSFLDDLTQLGKSGVKKPGKLLESFPRPSSVEEVVMISDEVTALCPKTGQPDMYVVKITYTPGRKCIESKSLKLKLQSLRSKGAFGEELSSQLVKHVMESIDPLDVIVELTQKSRGGVTITTTSRWVGIPTTPGVYRILNLVNGKVYVGSSVNLRGRWCGHRSSLNLNKHCNKYLQNAWNKYGEESFRFDILQETTENILICEEKWIAVYNACNPLYGYNICEKPSEGTWGFSHPHTEETKKKIAESLRGRKRGPCKAATRKKISEGNKGHKRTPESIQAQVERQTGKKKGPMSEETKKKISAANKGKTKGVPKSVEHRRKIGEGNKGKIVSEEARKKMSKAKKGITVSQETRKKISKASKGVPKSAEHRRKIREALIRRNAKKNGDGK